MSYNWAVNKTLSTDPEVKERLSYLSDIKFVFSKDKPEEGCYSCFKLFVGRKFYIVKSKSCMWIESRLNKLLKAYNSNGTDANDLYFPIVKQVHNTGYYDLQIEFICQSSNPYEVIKAEYQALTESFGNSLCLNANLEAYTPKWNQETQMFGWLTRNEFLNYKRLVHKHRVDLINIHQSDTESYSRAYYMRKASTTYKQIISIGTQMVPNILQYLDENKTAGRSIFILLEDITGEPAKSRRAWINWGKKNEHL